MNPEPSPPVEKAGVQKPAGVRGRSWGVRLLGWFWRKLRNVIRIFLISWAALVLYYSVIPWAWARIALAVAFAGFSIWALWMSKRPKARWVFAGVFAAVFTYWLCVLPSNDRAWRREVAVVTRAVVNGDRVRITGFRHFNYRSADDFDARYEEREVLLSRIVSVDLFVSYWEVGPVAHTFVSFNFDDGSSPVCISIEARPEVGEQFAAVASMFKQFELIYVVGDERDLVRVRTHHRNEEVFLYRVRATPEAAQRLFRGYLDRMNNIAGKPEWYHLLSNNCTLNIIRVARAAGRRDHFDHRYLLNGLIDRYMYGAGIVDTSLGFEELRRRAHINPAARAAGDAEDFSARIRASLPVTSPGP